MVIGSHTYSSHGFNCGVALKIQEKIINQGLTKNIFEKGNLMGKKINDYFADKHTIVGDVRGIGGFWTVEFVKDKKTKEVFDKKLDIGHKIQDLMFEKKINVMGMQGCVSNRTGEGDFILLAPSFVITDEDVDEIVSRVIDGIESYEKSLVENKEWA
ncbi:hypothetical protein FOG48_02766 [Hanseniaspora uvarum]|nr:hypothetical protein FOG48_02766 [Hanseniaspora uvarum]